LHLLRRMNLFNTFIFFKQFCVYNSYEHNADHKIISYLFFLHRCNYLYIILNCTSTGDLTLFETCNHRDREEIIFEGNILKRSAVYMYLQIMLMLVTIPINWNSKDFSNFVVLTCIEKNPRNSGLMENPPPARVESSRLSAPSRRQACAWHTLALKKKNLQTYRHFYRLRISRVRAYDRISL